MPCSRWSVCVSLLAALVLVVVALAVPLVADDAKPDVLVEKLEKGRSLLGGENGAGGREMLEQVIAGYRERLAGDPENIDARVQIGRALFYLEDDAGAAAELDTAIEKDPEHADARFFRALIHLYTGNVPAAERGFAVAVQLDPEDTRYRLQLARTWTRLGRHREALGAYDELIARQPQRADLHHARALAALELGRSEEALASFEEALEIDPEHASAAYNAGQLCQNLGRTEQALAHFEKATKIDTSDWRALAKVVQLSQALERFEDRDLARKKILVLRREGNTADLAEAREFCRDQFVVGDTPVLAMEQFDLVEPRYQKFRFYILDRAGGKVLWEISYGSMQRTTEVARELGDLGENERLYHLDGYWPNGRHATFHMAAGELSYDDVRKLMVGILEQRREEQSSSEPGGK